MQRLGRLTATVALVVAACGSDEGDIDTAAVCAAAVDISTAVDDETEAAAAQDNEGAREAADRARDAIDRLADLSERDDARDLSAAYGRHEPGAADLDERGTTSGESLSTWLAEVCDRPLTFAPSPPAPTTVEPRAATTITTSEAPTVTTTTVPVQYVLGSADAVVVGFLELWQQDRLDEVGPLAAPNVIDYLRPEPPDGRDYVLDECIETEPGTRTSCYGTIGGVMFEAILTADPVGYSLEQGPAWVIVDFYFLGE